MKEYTFDTPTGIMCAVEEDNRLISLDWRHGGHDRTALLRQVECQLNEYFDGKRRDFDLPFALKGTLFQQRVWHALCNIPYGYTCSYGDIARAVGNPKACRAVGMANNRNPIPIIIPCHRVIGSNGALVGYGGGMDKKLFLLQLEKNNL